MAEHLEKACAIAFGADKSASTKDLIATIKVRALLEFSLTNPEFQRELSLNAAKAARFRGVDLDDSELELLVRTFGQMHS